MSIHVISEPLIESLLNGYKFLWCQGEEWVLSISIVKLIEQSRGVFSGELTIEHAFKDKPTISGIRVNLVSQQARNTIAKRLAESKIIPGLDWPQLVDQICSECIKRHREGQPYQELWTSEDIPPLEYLVEPILLKGIPTVIFGEKGVTKSTLALLIYVTLLLPWFDNPLGMVAPNRTIKSLILDWETPGNIVQWTAKKLQEGMNLPAFPLYHRRCNVSLVDDLESIQKMVSDLKAEVVIIDSLARATGGELSKDTENVNRFFTALDKLNVTSLIIAQTSKDTDSKKKTIYGNVLFTYYARSIFELCKSQDVGEDEINVALFHRWSNLTRLQRPMGFRFSFNGAQTYVEQQDVSVTEFKTKVSGRQILLESLKSGGKNAKELAEEMSWQEASVRVLLSKLKKAGKVISLGEKKWGLLLQ